MTAVIPSRLDSPLPTAEQDVAVKRVAQSRAFLAVLQRDLFVTWRELVPFLLQTMIQPVFLLFIFGRVLSGIGYADNSYSQVLLPGLIAMNAFVVGLQNTALPLVLDFSVTREIEDRLLAPLSIRLVAVEKILFGAIRGTIGALLMVPVGFLVLQNVSWPVSGLLPAVGVVVLGAITGACLGMVCGTLVPPRHINVLFTVLLVPLIFTGATQFPWRALSDLRWFQVVCAVNPLTYVAEAIRSLLLSGKVESIPLPISLAALVAFTVVFGLTGIAGFHRRALT
ncbi:ABC transporter permease [Rugosimonospora acidiphila]|uniref:Transport permease protein n=1 Tax=Rugosimonospora acidiphila TaxID=556531 RepID=A0ABP9SUN1_9ACTN